MEWLYENLAVLIAAIIGVVGALLGVVITQIIENNRRRKELIDKAKPILINYTAVSSIAQPPVTEYYFRVEGSQSGGPTIGLFKNMDNGILFIDDIETQKKRYFPLQNATVDKNTVFRIFLIVDAGDNLEDCVMNGHDIYGNCYRYKCCFEQFTEPEHEFAVIDSMPTLISNAAKSRGRNYA